jgi:predicted DNA-binding WGR domain protein
MSFTTRYGKIGTSGQTSTKEYGSEEKAKSEHDKLVAEKTKKGYVEK